jgi:O-antigen/teichoic acid export membrane protein
MMQLKETAAQGIRWSMVAEFFRFTSQYLVTAILARILLPDDFGLLGMANVFVGVLVVINDRGWSNVLVQKRDITQIHISSVFWINIIFSMLFITLLIGSSTFIAAFYQRPVIRNIICMLSLSIFFDSLNIVQRALNRRELKFKLLAIAEIFSWVIGGVIGIICALQGLGVISLVLQILSMRMISVIILWRYTQWKPVVSYSLSAIKELMHFSLNVTGHAILSFFTNNIDYLLIGKYLGAHALGFYTLAFKLMMVPVRHIAWIVSQVMFSVFSLIQQDINKVRSNYIYMVKAVSVVTFPMVFGLFALAPEFIHCIIGPKWEPTIGIIRVLCVCSLLLSIGALKGVILLSLGRAEIQFKISLITTIATTVSIIIGLPWGIQGVVFAYTGMHILLSPLILIWANSLMNLSIKDFLKPLWNIIFYCIVMTLGIGIVKYLVHGSDFVVLAIGFVMGSACYILMLIMFESVFIKETADILLTFKNKPIAKVSPLNNGEMNEN